MAVLPRLAPAVIVACALRRLQTHIGRLDRRQALLPALQLLGQLVAPKRLAPTLVFPRVHYPRLRRQRRDLRLQASLLLARPLIAHRLALARVRLHLSLDIRVQDVVSIRTPVRGGDHRPGRRGRRLRCFNPRPRERGRQPRSPPTPRPTPGFNPRPRERGRLHDQFPDQPVDHVSTRAPVRGGDRLTQLAIAAYKRFNPRPRERGRPDIDRTGVNWKEVSTRAPVRGGDDERKEYVSPA